MSSVCMYAFVWFDFATSSSQFLLLSQLLVLSFSYFSSFLSRFFVFNTRYTNPPFSISIAPNEHFRIVCLLFLLHLFACFIYRVQFLFLLFVSAVNKLHQNDSCQHRSEKSSVVVCMFSNFYVMEVFSVCRVFVDGVFPNFKTKKKSRKKQKKLQFFTFPSSTFTD